VVEVAKSLLYEVGTGPRQLPRLLYCTYCTAQPNCGSRQATVTRGPLLLVDAVNRILSNNKAVTLFLDPAAAALV